VYSCSMTSQYVTELVWKDPGHVWMPVLSLQLNVLVADSRQGLWLERDTYDLSAWLQDTPNAHNLTRHYRIRVQILWIGTLSMS
jgi:hypothetical protein